MKKTHWPFQRGRARKVPSKAIFTRGLKGASFVKSGEGRVLEDTVSVKRTPGAWEMVVQVAGVSADGVKGTRLRGSRWAQSRGFRGPCDRGEGFRIKRKGRRKQA